MPQKPTTPWDAGDAARLMHLISTYKRGKIDWEAIGKDLGRSADSCRGKNYRLYRQRINPKINHSQAVSREVQKQYEQQQSVDWTKLAHTLGLTKLRCLEANQYNVGKAQWIYNPDEFSWNMANRMTTFIEDNYPKPLVINYTAVSNFMWVDMDDCTKMAKSLRGRIKWNSETTTRVTNLLAQGLDFADIGKLLSPGLCAKKVEKSYLSCTNSKTYTVLSDDEKQQAKDIIETHAKKMSFLKLRELIDQKIPYAKKQTLRAFVNSHAVTLPVYKARMRSFDEDHIARQILDGAKLTKLADQLDVPPLLLASVTLANASFIKAQVWAREETEKLMELLRSNARPYNWKSIAEVIGTKSSQQCYFRYDFIKKNGR